MISTGRKPLGIYLCSFRAKQEYPNMVYQDLIEKRDLGGDCFDVDLEPYDFYVCTPPCNYWSKANRYRETSEYSQKTKYLLPSMLLKLYGMGRPFIVENVRNDKMFARHGLFALPLFIYSVGRHTYWTNVPLDVIDVPVHPDGIRHKTSTKRQGSEPVKRVIDAWIVKVVEKGGRYANLV